MSLFKKSIARNPIHPPKGEGFCTRHKKASETNIPKLFYEIELMGYLKKNDRLLALFSLALSNRKDFFSRSG